MPQAHLRLLQPGEVYLIKQLLQSLHHFIEALRQHAELIVAFYHRLGIKITHFDLAHASMQIADRTNDAGGEGGSDQVSGQQSKDRSP
ncbi:hypothetical protein D3C73_1429090 [compost metagenome]